MLLAEPVVQNNTEKWIEKVTKDKERVRSYDKKERMVQPQAVIERIGELTKGDAVVVTDRWTTSNVDSSVLSIPK